MPSRLPVGTKVRIKNWYGVPIKKRIIGTIIQVDRSECSFGRPYVVEISKSVAFKLNHFFYSGAQKGDCVCMKKSGFEVIGNPKKSPKHKGS